jgi:hypothetical protein
MMCSSQHLTTVEKVLNFNPPHGTLELNQTQDGSLQQHFLTRKLWTRMTQQDSQLNKSITSRSSMMFQLA